ncbi:hypothetical protein GF376_03690 [Candidatus Peregrinibacteria bacterium]|nr:hypothetical protein [Candidatus Peregrinibacteria bacterium]
MNKKSKKEDTYSYRGWLNSDFFLKRSFAIYGYMAVAGLIITGIIYGIIAIIAIIIFGSLYLTGAI